MRADAPSSFETVGHIAHVNLRDELLPYKRLVGQVLLDKNPAIRSVINKARPAPVGVSSSKARRCCPSSSESTIRSAESTRIQAIMNPAMRGLVVHHTCKLSIRSADSTRMLEPS